MVIAGLAKYVELRWFVLSMDLKTKPRFKKCFLWSKTGRALAASCPVGVMLRRELVCPVLLESYFTTNMVQLKKLQQNSLTVDFSTYYGLFISISIQWNWSVFDPHFLHYVKYIKTLKFVWYPATMFLFLRISNIQWGGYPNNFNMFAVLMALSKHTKVGQWTFRSCSVKFNCAVKQQFE